MLTAGLCTKRKEPQFRWMCDSFVRALEFSPMPVELIVSDGWLWEPDERGGGNARRQQLADAVAGRFSYRHVAPKPTNWQGPTRKTKSDYYDLNGSRNTIIALARGQHVILFDDCSVLDEAFFLHHARAAERGICVAGTFRSYTEAKIEFGKVLEGTLHPSGEDHRGKDTKQCSGSWMFGLNTSFPVEWALRVNGYDEKYSGQGGVEDCDFGLRLAHAGALIVYMPECRIDQLLMTHDPVCGEIGWGATKQQRKMKERVLADGRPHFANEWLITEWARNPVAEAQGNDFDLREIRRRALKTGEFPTERAVTHDWRDGQPLAEME